MRTKTPPPETVQTHVAVECRLTKSEATTTEVWLHKMTRMVTRGVIPVPSADEHDLLTGLRKLTASLHAGLPPFDG